MYVIENVMLFPVPREGTQCLGKEQVKGSITQRCGLGLICVKDICKVILGGTCRREGLCGPGLKCDVDRICRTQLNWKCAAGSDSCLTGLICDPVSGRCKVWKYLFLEGHPKTSSYSCYR